MSFEGNLLSLSLRFRGRLAALLLGVAVALAGARAEAIPVFARRYRTTCQTCHVAFPVLTPFGEAFRRNGYRFAGGADEDYQRQEPVPLGASAYRDLFPRSVWPGELPGTAPLSAFLTTQATLMPNETGTLEMSGIQGSVGLNAVAPVGNLLTLWAGASLDFKTNLDLSVRLQRAFAVVTPFTRPWVTLRIGRMEPTLLSFSSHRMWGWSCYPWLLVDRQGNSQLPLESPLSGSQLGAELTGVVLRGRATYTLGAAQPSGTAEYPRNVYARIGYKFGGMRLDGETSGEPDLALPAPWREWSAQVGLFGLVGGALPVGARPGAVLDPITLVGGDVNSQLGNLNVLAGYSFGHSRYPLPGDRQFALPTVARNAALADPSQWSEVSTHNLMAQASYVVFPWLIPSLRYEWQRRASDSPDPAAVSRCERSGASASCASDTRHRFVGFLTFLVRANVRASVVATIQRTTLGETEIEHIEFNLMAGY